MKLTFNIATCFLLLILCSCNKESTDPYENLIIPPSPSVTPKWLQGKNVLLYENISYGDAAQNKFDIIVPKSGTPVSLAIYIHGGGFTSGDKSSAYTSPETRETILHLLKHNIAFATINYQYLESDDHIGVFKPLNDCRTALQFIRFYSKRFNINKNKIALMGGSAGGGACLWLGLSYDTAQPESPIPFLRESTRVEAVVCTDPQSNYDILQWHNTIFTEYQPQGFSFKTIQNLVSISRILKFYGVSTMEDLYTIDMWVFRYRVNMLSFITIDDPEIYVINTRKHKAFPFSMDILLHHPLHAKALMDQAESVGITSKFHIPSMGIDTRGGETVGEFLARKLKDDG